MKNERITLLIRTLGKITVRFVLPALVLVVTMLWLTGAFRHGRIASQPDTMPAAEPVSATSELLTVTSIPRAVVAQMVGEVKPEYQINLTSKITAHILRLDVRAGERVRKGQLLVTLDDRDLAARVNQARKALAQAQATLSYAQLDYERTRNLQAKGAIPQADLDVADTRRKQAQADLDRLGQAVEEAQVNVGYAKIECPVDGVVIDRQAEVGDLATPAKPVLVLFDPQHLWLQASVSEEYAPLLKLGREYRMRIDALKEDFTGTLAEIVPAADPTGRTILARIRLKPDDRLYPGLFGRLNLSVKTTEDILLPQRAIRQVGQLQMVTVRASWGLEQRVVVPGAAESDGLVEILSGLKAGETVVLPPANQEPRP